MSLSLRSKTILPKSANALLHLEIEGVVQGLGFRPFVWNLAHQMELSGWVRNSARGVQIEVEGPAKSLEEFMARLKREKPAHAELKSIRPSSLSPKGYREFQILPSAAGSKTAGVLPDLATCQDCLKEIFDPSDRRYRYPFTNCTHCGPRFSILKTIPYDRPNTTMSGFKMCPACRREYEDPRNRRFHAQPNACPQCGPQLTLKDSRGRAWAKGNKALNHAVQLISQGKILALKGLGGFHLVVDARNPDSLQSLRTRKRRPEKPFALMFPDLKLLKTFVKVSPLEEKILLSPESPIVLLERRRDPPYPLAGAVAPGNPYLGSMLPYTPLHHLLMVDLGFPIVATSGNRSEEPICIDGAEAQERLRDIADFYLDHNRPLARPVDDSVIKPMAGGATLLRRARGYAPGTIPAGKNSGSLLATGGHLKNTVAFQLGKEFLLSQHIGDLETAPAREAFEEVIESFQRFYQTYPKKIICDLHPEYASHRWACQKKSPVIPVQHHHAHVVACMAEHDLRGPVLGLAWDGLGYGPDRTLWGGEFLHCTRLAFQRRGHFRYWKLPGGEQAVREPRRSALGLLYEIFGEQLFSQQEMIALLSFSEKEMTILHKMLAQDLNTPRTCSVGRLFDGVAALVGLAQKVSFEGQAAMALEFAASHWRGPKYTIQYQESSTGWVLDWEAMVREILQDLKDKVLARVISQKFHRSLVEAAVQMAKRVGENTVILSGGCFQNKFLCEGAVAKLREEGFQPYWHQKIPPNDGGIALGQAAIGSEQEENSPCA